MNSSSCRGYIMSDMRTLSLVVALSLALPGLASGQVTTVDEGTFTITRGGTRPSDRIGQESFTIRRTRGPGGDVVVANATVTFDTERLAPALRTDTSFSPLAYEVEVRTGADVERLRGRQCGDSSPRRGRRHCTDGPTSSPPEDVARSGSPRGWRYSPGLFRKAPGTAPGFSHAEP